MKIPISVLKGIQSPETVVIEDTQGNQYAKSYQEEQKVLQVTLDKTGDYFITDGQSSNSVQENQGEAGADQTGFSVKDSETEVAVTDEIMQEDGEILSDMNDTRCSSGIRRIRTQGKFVDRERFETICKKFSGFDNSRSGASDWIFDSEKKTQEVKKITIQ